MSKIRRAFAIQMIGVVVFLILLAWAARHFDLVHIIVRMQKRVDQMEVWGGIFYVPLYAGCNVLLLPASFLTFGSGLCFGLWWGFVLSLAGNVLGAALAFVLSRKLGRHWVEKKFFQDKKWRVLDEAIAREGWKIIFLSQVHPLFPTSILNYLYGITRIRFWPCMLWVALGQTPGIFLYTYVGTLAQLGIKLAKGRNHPHPVEYVIWFGGLLVTLIVTVGLGRIALKLLAEVEREADQHNAVIDNPNDLKKPFFDTKSKHGNITSSRHG